MYAGVYGVDSEYDQEPGAYRHEYLDAYLFDDIVKQRGQDIDEGHPSYTEYQ